jgi:hypothetical protein
VGVETLLNLGAGKMLTRKNRALIMEALGDAVDDVVREEYSPLVNGRSLVQEPAITPRICDRVEQRLNGKTVGDYRFKVNAEVLTDRGQNSAESLLGADLALSVSLDGPGGFDKTLLIQAKYDREADRDELLGSCRKMEKLAGRKGTYIWLYGPDGVKVITPHQVEAMEDNDFEGLYHRSMKGLTGRILDCNAGSKRIGIPRHVPNRKQYLRAKLEQWRAKAALDVALIRS